ncbi:NUDIX hydrolase [Micromonospora sp. WMMD882]|uniref:NUDIX domain-containing protein n=1 Tax=Micromonospora sp. WMMD882 TaxID=3015151 RepID=UPI00248BA59E|nr:NUDIX hydrolase [Micromonospora sp. WMMD882]WBB78453.1 NUDIX hydrolase [Micromonospora sp. WMMD882]
MTERVRAILLTPTDGWLVFRRTRPDRDVYWSLPGGGVEPDDPDRRAALLREVREEVGGTARIHSLRYVLDTPAGRQYLYLCRIDTWCEADRTGAEFSDPTAGGYLLETRRLDHRTLAAITLSPPGLADLLAADLRRSDGDLFRLPGLPEGPD